MENPTGSLRTLAQSLSLSRPPVATDVAGDHDSKSQESTGGDFGAQYCSRFFVVLVLSPLRRTVLVLVIEAIWYSNPTHWSASYRKPPRSTSPQFKQPSSTSTTKKSFNPQPTARKSLFCPHIVLSNATSRTSLVLSSINAKSFTAEEVSYHDCLDSITSTSTVSLSMSTTKSDVGHDLSLTRLGLSAAVEKDPKPRVSNQ